MQVTFTSTYTNGKRTLILPLRILQITVCITCRLQSEKIYIFLNSVDVISYEGQLTSFRRLCFQNQQSQGLFLLQPEGNTQIYLFQDQWSSGAYIRICKTYCRKVNPAGMEQEAQGNNTVFFVFKTPGPGCSKGD